MRINLLQLGTEGVDMKTNPLLLGNKKLHAATNIAFDEGVIRTRPGFRYTATRAEGQFQGAGEFRPRLGLSANTLSSVRGGVVIVADGEVWSGCNRLGDGFFCKGDVNVFQAENYLIFQCREAPTFWWDGMSGLVQSPGMNEQDWNDPETPQQVLETVAPVADIPDCGVEGAEGHVTVTFNVVNAETEAPVVGALVTVYKNGSRAYYGMTGDDGKWSTEIIPRTYNYTVTRNGYPPLEDVAFVVLGEGSEYQWDECVNPLLIVTGETAVDVRLSTLQPPPDPDDPGDGGGGGGGEGGGGVDLTCGHVIEDADASVSLAYFTIINTGTAHLTIISASITGCTECGSLETHASGYELVSLPYALAPGESLYVSRGGYFEGSAGYSVTMQCLGDPYDASGVIPNASVP